MADSRGVSHIQYADDTVIMIDGSEKSILSLKLILYCFEWLSGLKINFHKSDVYVFGEDQERKEVLANMLNCRLGEWPMKYLGLPIAEHRVGSRAFMGLVDKMRKRLDPWKGRNLSLGGRLVLTNSCLSSLPMYTMGFYLLPKSVHLEMDQIRSNFFWQGAKEEFRYHMAKMDTICRPKNQGGLGMINTSTMNECLLVKWIWRIAKGSNETWFKILQAKYMQNGSFFSSSPRGASQFWQSLHKVKHLFKWGAIFQVKDGANTMFWEDTWKGDTPIKIQFPDLYKMCANPRASVADCWDGENWIIPFRRSLTTTEKDDLDKLLLWLQPSSLSVGLDNITWALENSKVFSTKSLYSFMTNRGVMLKDSNSCWKVRTPLKIKVFLWQLSNDRLQTATALKRRGWKGSHLCCLCGKPENVDHIFFRCSLARFLWAGVGEALGLAQQPGSWEDLVATWSKNCNFPKRLGMLLFASLAWALWTTRNKMAIEHIFPNNAIQTFHVFVGFMQR